MAISRITKNNSAESKKDFLKELWEEYARFMETSQSPTCTELFFSSLKPTVLQGFHSSTKRIIQLGSSAGQYFVASGLSKKRDVIGYDSANCAIGLLQKNHMQARAVDLNHKSTYESQLAQDLTIPVDLLAIRIFEHLNPNAVISLIFSLLALSKSGTTFYFSKQHLSSEKKNAGYLASFFPRTDIEFILHTTKKGLAEEMNCFDETLVIKKI